MEVVSFCLGIILAMMFKKIVIIIEVILCLLTTFLLVKLVHPEIILTSIDDWTFASIFKGYNFWWLTILFFILSWGLIYGVIPYLLNEYLIKNKFDRFISKYDNYSEFDKERVKKILKYITTPINYLVDMFEYLRIKKDNNNNNNFNPKKDIPKIMIHGLIIVIHFSVVLPFFIDAKIVSISALILGLYHLIILPLFGLYITPIIELIDESNPTT